MATVYLYVLGASTNPDGVDCVVPWRVDDGEIFFGPCKISLRERLRSQLLGPDSEYVRPQEDVYFVGVNALSPGQVRKIVWAGKMIDAMSFGRAWRELSGARYEKLRAGADGYSPLHLEPIEGGGRPTAYRHRGKEHLEGQMWLADILDRGNRGKARATDSEVKLPRGTSWWDGFRRDICFRFENLFFARGQGLTIDAEFVRILAARQWDREGVTATAIFGVNAAGKPDGRRGRWLEIRGDLADRVVVWLRSRHQGTTSSFDAPRRPGHC